MRDDNICEYLKREINLNTKRNVEDDFIENIDLETGDYTQTKHIKDKKLGLVGFSLFSIGFLLQFLGIMFEL